VVGTADVLAGPLVTRLRYLLLGVLVAGGVAVLVIAILGSRGHSSTARSLPHGQVLAAAAKIEPQSLLFGDPVHIRIDAVVDRRQLEPTRIHLDANWAPYQPVAPMLRKRTDVGPYTRLRWTIDLHCVIVDCVPQAGSIARQVFPSTTVKYSGLAKDGTTPSPVTITWPQISAVSRLDPVDMERRAIVQRIGPAGQVRAILPPWRVNTDNLDPVSYAISPGTVFWGALGLAFMLVLGAGFLLRPYLPGFGWLPRRSQELSRLELALEAVERARGGETAEERKALELLADELRKTGSGGLAWTATELAWSPSEPPPDQTVALTENVRRALAGRTNGHRA
jgi:hypothetical protein